MFSDELDRAREEHEGTGLEAERLAEARSSRQSARRASFGQGAEDEPRSDEARTREPEASAAEDVRALPRSEPATARSSEPASAPLAEAAPEVSSTASGSAPAEEPPASVQPVAAPSASVTGPGAAALLARMAPEHAAPAAAAASAAAPAAEPAPLASAPRAPDTKPASAAATREPAGHAALARAEEILRQVELHLAAGVKRLSFELTPADLGRLSIQLALRGGKVAAIVRGERAETLELLRSREADLKRLLAERGIATDGVRFELGFRTPSEARHARPSTSSGSDRTARAGGGPASFDSYA